MSFRAMRLRAGLSVIEAANRLQVTRATIFNWEHGVTLPIGRDFERITSVYECTADELLEDNPKPQIKVGEKNVAQAKKQEPSQVSTTCF